MTIEQLLGYSLEEMEKMTDEEWEKKLQPYFQVTRPSISKETIKAKVITSGRSSSSEAAKLIKQIEALVKKPTTT